MTKQSPSLKILIALFLLGITMAGAFAFTPEALDGASRPPSNFQAFTTAGQARMCSQYADETGVFVGAKTLRTQFSPALVNVYYVNNGGWSYYNEFSIPAGSNSLQFSGGNRQYAYEIYYCPVTANSCTGTGNRAVTETSYQKCTNGAWSNEIKCPSGQYYSTSSNTCQQQSCHEQWNCGSWGQCTGNGKQYRTCTDTNACATSKDRPATEQSCTPSPATGTTKEQIGRNIQLIGQPKLDAYTGSTGTVRTVTQRVKVTQAGSYWLEAGIEPLRTFNIAATIEHNTCNPEETWYANQQIPLAPGEQDVTLKVTPGADGEYVLHTAIVTTCAGEVVSQVNAADHLLIGNPDNGSSILSLSSVFGTLKGSGALLFIVSSIVIGVAAVGIYATRKKRRR